MNKINTIVITSLIAMTMVSCGVKQTLQNEAGTKMNSTTGLISKDQFDKIDAFGVGNPNDGFAQYFIGNSYLKPLTNMQNGEVPIFNVSFEPGCRNNWHIHHSTSGGGQVLICTAGSGWYQQWGEEPVSLEPGMVIVIPPNTKHWHGAKKDSWFSHVTFEPAGENTSNEWCEPVTDEEYNKL